MSSRRRAGISLIHTLGMIVVIGSLMTLSMSVVYQAYDSHHRAVEHINEWQRLNILRERFCEDAHRSVSAEIGETLVLNQGAEEFTYEVAGDEVIRTHLSKGTEVGKRSWVLPGRVTSIWRIDDSGALPLLRWEMICEVGNVRMRTGSKSTKSGGATTERQFHWLARVGVFDGEADLRPDAPAQGGDDGVE